jgi:hypothetical protein
MRGVSWEAHVTSRGPTLEAGRDALLRDPAWECPKNVQNGTQWRKSRCGEGRKGHEDRSGIIARETREKGERKKGNRLPENDGIAL